MKYFVWGIGERLSKNINSMCFNHVIGFVDKRAKQEAAEYLGKPLIMPQHILGYQFDYIVISSNKYFEEISRQCILELGIDCRKIVRLDWILSEGKGEFIDAEMQLKYRDVLELTAGSKKAGIVRNWMRKDVSNHRSEWDCINHDGYIFPVSWNRKMIRIYQVTHKIFQPIGNRNYRAFGVGMDRLPYPMDNTGDHIAEYNMKINECTALYWIWKHSKAEYIGINHYRRVFESELNHGWPLQDAEALLLLKKCDIIVAKAVTFQNNTVVSMLRKEICEEAFDQSWKILLDIFEQKSEEEKEAFFLIMNGSIIFPCNMFIMNKERVDKYCTWLFPILFEMLDKVEIKDGWNTYSKRVIGFWAERMFTVWLYFSGYQVKELPVLLIGDGTPYGKE